MILISHRGNTSGPDSNQENHPDYVLKTLQQGYDVEIDVWYTGKFMLGHDEPQYDFPFNLIEGYHTNLWIHCKNVKALLELNKIDHYPNKLNYFWHEKDTITLTSQNYIWAYPGNQPIQNSIAVMPELYNDNLDVCKGICSDYIINYKE